LVENRRKNLPPTPPSFGTFLWGDPLRIFRRLIRPCQKLESDRQMGHVAVAKTALAWRRAGKKESLHRLFETVQENVILISACQPWSTS